MFENARTFETTLAGRPLRVETGKLAQLAGGSCLVRYGDTVVLCTATASDKPRDGIDFFPLSVDYEEKLYAVGKIPGSFQRREGRPSEKAILTSRVIDRPIRPLFPKDMRNDVSVVCTVMSVDPDCAPETVAMLGTSVAIAISPIPWDGPIAGCVVGLVDGQFVINPTAAQEKVSQMHVTVASTADLVAMIEAGAQEVDNDTMFNGIMAGHAANQQMVAFIQDIARQVGKPKNSFESVEVDSAMFEAVKAAVIEDMRYALDTDDKRVRDARIKPVYEKAHAALDAQYPEQAAQIDECLYKLQKFIVRRWLLDDGKRVDGRGID
ncbi:MAG: polyribonucleotide nucleotidyltransferase, partial [Oscillospiraceae bacterium]|nr:polyribonucleotide nucleotidyltransferase [Oscillospiraceae bacterium]